MRYHTGNFLRSGPEKILQQLTLLRCLGVEGKGPPADSDIIFFLQSFNTPGNEITIGSYIIGEDFQFHFLALVFVPVQGRVLKRYTAVRSRGPCSGSIFHNKYLLWQDQHDLDSCFPGGGLGGLIGQPIGKKGEYFAH